MKKTLIAFGALAGAALLPAAAFAQTTTDAGQPAVDSTQAAPAAATPDATYGAQATGSSTAGDAPAGTPAAPDGTRAFGIEPYLGIMGGYEDFDSDNKGPITTNCNGRSGCPDGGLIEAVGGINIPLGPLFVGAEGSVAKGFKGIDWEYGAFGRVGFRAGDSGIIYGKGGRMWVNTDDKPNNDNWEWGLGVEVGPKTIGLGGLTNNAGVRIRLEATTYDLHSIRPMGGVIFHF